ELIIGVRDDKSDKPGERRGVRLYKALDDKGTKWARHILDDGGIAVEDLAAADLDGDGRIDIVAVGRRTHNIRSYWNKGHAKEEHRALRGGGAPRPRHSACRQCLRRCEQVSTGEESAL